MKILTKLQIPLWKNRAREGDAAAQYMLGFCYYLGEGVSLNYTEAAKWYHLAANQEHADGLSSLGLCYLLGRGVPRDSSEAVKWLGRAADKGHIGASALIPPLIETAKFRNFREKTTETEIRLRYDAKRKYAHSHGCFLTFPEKASREKMLDALSDTGINILVAITRMEKLKTAPAFYKHLGSHLAAGVDLKTIIVCLSCFDDQWQMIRDAYEEFFEMSVDYEKALSIQQRHIFEQMVAQILARHPTLDYNKTTLLCDVLCSYHRDGTFMN